MSSISIIIPVLNEEKNIARILQYLQYHQYGFVKEIIVVDGGSTDDTLQTAAINGAQVICSEKGRAKQMNAGAKAASGNILYFLHADSYPPRYYDKYIIDNINGIAGSGCFKMKFNSNHWLLKVSGWFTRFNSSWCRGGDQSLFIYKDLFYKAGAFNENYIIYEDNEILYRIRKVTGFTVIQDKPIITSARRYIENGVIRLQYIFLTIHIMHRLGYSHDKMLERYKKKVR